MTTYRTIPTKTLKPGDKVVFNTPKGRLTGIVSNLGEFMNFPDHGNSFIFRSLGIADAEAFCAKAYGYAPNGGDWPQAKDGDFKALTRAVRAVLQKCRKPTKAQLAKLAAAEKREAAKAAAAAKAEQEAEAKAKAEREARRAALPTPGKVFLAYLDAHPGAFGCQRRHVVATVGAILGVDLTDL